MLDCVCFWAGAWVKGYMSCMVLGQSTSRFDGCHWVGHRVRIQIENCAKR